jgi:hypothetical protein
MNGARSAQKKDSKRRPCFDPPTPEQRPGQGMSQKSVTVVPEGFEEENTFMFPPGREWGHFDPYSNEML